MKKEEKTALTKDRILHAAMQEFGTNGYTATTLNAICSHHGISKGLFYHNFKGKDDLYLLCVSRCLSGLIAYFKKQEMQDDLRKYMQRRFQYFSENPLCSRIFFEAVVQPPKHLAGRIKELKKELDLFHINLYHHALSKLTLRKGVTQADALEYYEMMQEMLNGSFRSSTYAEKEFGIVMFDHEKKLEKLLDFMLYGIAERSEPECSFSL